jgi:hypothetical protein
MGRGLKNRTILLLGDNGSETEISAERMRHLSNLARLNQTTPPIFKQICIECRATKKHKTGCSLGRIKSRSIQDDAEKPKAKSQFSQLHAMFERKTNDNNPFAGIGSEAQNRVEGERTVVSYQKDTLPKLTTSNITTSTSMDITTLTAMDTISPVAVDIVVLTTADIVASTTIDATTTIPILHSEDTTGYEEADDDDNSSIQDDPEELNIDEDNSNLNENSALKLNLLEYSASVFQSIEITSASRSPYFSYPEPLSLQNDNKYKYDPIAIWASQMGKLQIWHPVHFFPQQRYYFSCKCGKTLTSEGYSKALTLLMEFSGQFTVLQKLQYSCRDCPLAKIKGRKSKWFNSGSSHILAQLPPLVRESYPAVIKIKSTASLGMLRAVVALRQNALPFAAIAATHEELVRDSIARAELTHLRFIEFTKHTLDSFISKDRILSSSSLSLLGKRGIIVCEKKMSQIYKTEINRRVPLMLDRISRTPFKIIKADHTFFIASLARESVVSNDRKSFRKPFAAVLTCMNECQEIGYFAFVGSKSYEEVRSDLEALVRRPHPAYDNQNDEITTKMVYIDNPEQEASFFSSIAPNISIRRDAFHLLQAFYKCCSGSRPQDRDRFMALASGAMFSFVKEDMDNYRKYLGESYKPEQVEQIMNSPDALIRSKRVRRRFRPRTEIKSLLHVARERFMSRNLFRAEFYPLFETAIKEIDSGYYDNNSVVGVEEDIQVSNGSSCPYVMTVRGTSQLENYHSGLNDMIANCTSPSMMHALTVDFTYRFNVKKSNLISGKGRSTIGFDPDLNNRLAEHVFKYSLKNHPLFDWKQLREPEKDDPNANIGVIRKNSSSEAKLSIDTFLSDFSDTKGIELYTFIQRRVQIAPGPEHVLTGLPTAARPVSTPDEILLMEHLLRHPESSTKRKSTPPLLKAADYSVLYDI